MEKLSILSKEKMGELLVTLGSGTLAGSIATLFNAPFDVVKSRFQNQLHDGNGVLKYRWTLQTLALIKKEEGVRAMYKGLAPKLWRMSIGGGVSMFVFELICAL